MPTNNAANASSTLLWMQSQQNLGHLSGMQLGFDLVTILWEDAKEPFGPLAVADKQVPGKTLEVPFLKFKVSDAQFNIWFHIIDHSSYHQLPYLDFSPSFDTLVYAFVDPLDSPLKESFPPNHKKEATYREIKDVGRVVNQLVRADPKLRLAVFNFYYGSATSISRDEMNLYDDVVYHTVPIAELASIKPLVADLMGVR